MNSAAHLLAGFILAAVAAGMAAAAWASARIEFGRRDAGGGTGCPRRRQGLMACQRPGASRANRRGARLRRLLAISPALTLPTPQRGRGAAGLRSI